ncbi:Na(+)/H(+) antiporter subunit B [Shumkonia mesophila]|uniref:Na(+)/H(+) antiporter subunit B n=1 Tax=Shumkonia mesophila TaxID=2838854 RepID=UPI0029340E31|nr:hydrogenase subunit MbhD domain-containing protein [Shumkonia mesophila]
MILVDILVCAAMVVTGVAAIFQRSLLSAVIMVGFISLMVSYLFLRMDAPDVAMTEAAIAAGLTTVIFLIAIRRTEDSER